MGKIGQYPTSDELDRLDRIHEAGKLEQEATLQQNFGNRDQRRHERKRVNQEWERIKSDKEGGLPEERVWANHLRRMQGMAASMNDAGKCKRRAAHFKRDGLESAAKLFDGQAAKLEGGSMEMVPQVAKSFDLLSRLAIEKSEEAAQASALDQFMQELDSTKMDVQEKAELQQLAEEIANMLGLGQGTAVVDKSRWQRADGSWWQTNPEGGKPVPWRPPHSSREGKEERKKATAALSPERRKSIGGLISQGEKALITRAENELRKPTGYQKAATLPPNTTPEYKKANSEVGQYMGMSKAYLDRAKGIKEGYGSSPKDRRFWAAMAMIMTDKTKKAVGTLRNTPMLPKKTEAEGISQAEAASRIGAAAQSKKPSTSPITLPAGAGEKKEPATVESKKAQKAKDKSALYSRKARDLRTHSGELFVYGDSKVDAATKVYNTPLKSISSKMLAPGDQFVISGIASSQGNGLAMPAIMGAIDQKKGKATVYTAFTPKGFELVRKGKGWAWGPSGLPVSLFSLEKL